MKPKTSCDFSDRSTIERRLYHPDKTDTGYVLMRDGSIRCNR